MPRDAVMLGIRMEFTMNEFFAQGGVVTFADRMAAVLGIHAADIKVVAVYEGSTIVDFFVQQAENIEEAIDLTKIKETFETAVEVMDEFMGSPVLGAIAEGAVIATKHETDLSTDDDGNNLWDEVFGDDDEDLTPEEQEVAIEFVYRNSSNEDDKITSENLSIYIYGLGVIIVIMIIAVIVICCYNRYVVKINIERTQALQHEYQEGQGYDRRGSENNRRMPMQYDPKADVDELVTGIGAINTGRHSSRPL
jgi:hypothetical protein